MSKKTAYTIIDHFGSLDQNTINLAYTKANKLSVHPKEDTFTIKRFCTMLSHNPDTKVTDKQKNFVRFNFHPEQVIIITVDHEEPKTKWYIDNWAEKTDNLIVLEVFADTNNITHVEEYTMKDLHPEWFVEDNPKNSKARRCANIWANALGWTFSAPLYRDNSRELDEMYLKRPDRKIYANILGMSNHITKIASKPESYINSKIAVASEDECKAFYEHYAYLCKNNLLNDFLEPGYQLCPHCGRPIRIGVSNNANCVYCDYETEDFEITPYYETSKD